MLMSPKSQGLPPTCMAGRGGQGLAMSPQLRYPYQPQSRWQLQSHHPLKLNLLPPRDAANGATVGLSHPEGAWLSQR